MKISETLAKYDTDKVTGHSYGDAYDELFSRFDRQAHLNILEIGTQKGGSLCAWKEYFPNANITGVDIIDVRRPEYIRNDITYIFDDIKNVKPTGAYDIIIDDGSHFIEDVLHVVKNFKDALTPNGLMVIEDVQDVGAWRWNIDRCLQNEKISFKDMRYIKGNYDDYMFIIEK